MKCAAASSNPNTFYSSSSPPGKATSNELKTLATMGRKGRGKAAHAKTGPDGKYAQASC